ncbi:MAG: hypothetical protein DMD72_02050 [Gemmatimonadetes bacterium]|nr:MAG: hypothetical protein DMD72_02050 [Gemmatimonadota bacterium]
MSRLVRASLAFSASAGIACAPAPSLTPAPAQALGGSLYMPRAVQQAYRSGTRSLDGRPGPNYWQNRGRYVIAITALPPDRTIRGVEQITYFNNSPDTLRNPVIKLFMNIHKPGAPRAYPARPDYLTPGVQIDSVAVNGQATQWQGVQNAFTWITTCRRIPAVKECSIRPLSSSPISIRV